MNIIPATYHIGSDRYAGDIVETYANGKKAIFLFRDSKRVLRLYKSEKHGTSNIWEISGAGRSGCVVQGYAEDSLDPSF